MDNKKLIIAVKYTFLLCLSLMISACGRISLSLTDAPVDSADAVMLAITGVELQPVTGDTTNIDFKSVRLIDLMKLTDGVTDILLEDEPLPKGKYSWIKLKLDIESSFVTVNGTDITLRMPVDAESGLQVSREFEIKTGSANKYVIDFDLRKSLYSPEDGNDDYVLRPMLRIVDESIIGSVKGSVDASLLSSSVDCYDNAGAVTAVLYIFSGKNIIPDDIDGISPEPLTSSIVKQDLSYNVEFLEEGEYTAALSCEAIQDDPATDDSINFLRTRTMTVIKGQQSLLGFTF